MLRAVYLVSGQSVCLWCLSFFFFFFFSLTHFLCARVRACIYTCEVFDDWQICSVTERSKQASRHATVSLLSITFCLPVAFHPDRTSVVAWALKIKYLSIYVFIVYTPIYVSVPFRFSVVYNIPACVSHFWPFLFVYISLKSLFPILNWMSRFFLLSILVRMFCFSVGYTSMYVSFLC